MFKTYLSVALFMSGLVCFSQSMPTITGAVARPGVVDAKTLRGLNKYNRLVKIADANGKFLASLEVSGYALKDVLERKEVKKQDDGFDKPMDIFITAKGQGGKSVLFSYGEVFLSDDEGVILADSARMVLPHRHPPLNVGKNDPTILLDIKRRGSINLDSCVSCHNGDGYDELYFPKGWLLISAQDGFAGRFVEYLTEINIAQVGIKATDTRRSGGRDSFIESPTIVGPDGKNHEFKADDFQKLPRLKMEDAGVGLGTGFRGIRVWEGAPLKGMLQHLVPQDVDPRSTYVLVTAADGYRSLFSGAEVFCKADEKCVLIIDRRDGKALERGQGQYAMLPRGDFYADRHVRMVKEIRLVIPTSASNAR